MKGERRRRRIPRSVWRRGLYSFVLTALVMIAGTFGLMLIEKMRAIDAFYFMSMLATAQGPPSAPATDLGKIFASMMAFVSVGTVVTSLVFIFGPFFGVLLRMGAEEVEKEVHKIESREKEDS